MKIESTLTTGVRRKLGPDEIELFVRTERNEIRRMIADREELSTFIESQLAQLKATAFHGEKDRIGRCRPGDASRLCRCRRPGRELC